jgi:hypothetical protein
MTAPIWATATPFTTPLSNDNHRIGPYITGHPIHLVAVIRIVMTYHMVVDHDTTLRITSLQIICTLLICIPGVALCHCSTQASHRRHTSARARKARLKPRERWESTGSSVRSLRAKSRRTIDLPSTRHGGSSPQPNGTTPCSIESASSRQGKTTQPWQTKPMALHKSARCFLG